MKKPAVIYVPIPPAASGFSRLLSGAPQTCGMKSGALVLQPEESVGAHSTHEREEAIVLLEGNAALIIAGQEAMRCGAPGIVYIPPRTEHDLRNVGAGPLRYVYVVSPVADTVAGSEHGSG